MHEAVIQATELRKSYGPLEAVRGIDLLVERGEVFGFLGPNGAGKSTTINMLCTLLRPSGGRAEVAGIDVDADPAAVRARIGLVFQDPSLDDMMTARENLDMHAAIYGVPQSVRKERIAEVLQVVQLTDRAGSLVRTFSGGMKRRLEIARGILHYPQVLFLDEPTLGLDPQTRNHIWGYLHAVRKREGITVFMTTHYMDEAEYCDRIAIIDQGKIVALGTPQQLKDMVGGDVITIATSDAAAAADEIWQKYEKKAITENGSLRLEVDEGRTFLPKLLRELSVPVQSVAVRRPSLDDVFMKLTGHGIREQGAGDIDTFRQMANLWRRR
jgi:ABC-2 type transport system ATP-binding protein